MATRKSRTLTPEQQAKSEARRARFGELARQIGAMSADEQRMVAAGMPAVTIEGHSLSLHNACLLACQCPTATMVGGFQQWITAGRVVRKGEHGLMIWAPVRERAEASVRHPVVPTTSANGGSDRPRFIMVTVFDVSQTDALKAVDTREEEVA